MPQSPLAQVSQYIGYVGEQHYRPWGNEGIERFNKRVEYDNKKMEYCKSNNIPLIIIPFDKTEIKLEDLIQ